MSGIDYSRHVQEDVRLIVLRELAAQADGRLNDTMLTHVIEAFGHTKSREWLRTQLDKLQELDAIRIHQVGTITVAQITRAGLEHVQRRSFIAGVARPSPAGA